MNIQVVLYTSEFQHPGLLLLKETLRAWDWPEPYVYGGEGRWMGHPWKLQSLRREIPRIKDKTGATHIVFVDSWDTVCCGPMAAVADECCGRSTLLAGESICFPDQERETEYQFENRSRWRFVNGGGLVGDIDFIGDVLLDGVDSADCDQRFLTRFYLNRLYCTPPPFGVSVDDRCKIFQTLGGCETWSDFFQVINNQHEARVFNTQTGSFPIFIHGNARTDMSWVPGCVGKWQPWWNLPNYGIPEKSA